MKPSFACYKKNKLIWNVWIILVIATSRIYFFIQRGRQDLSFADGVINISSNKKTYKNIRSSLFT